MKNNIPFEVALLTEEELAYIMAARKKKHEQIRNFPEVGEVFTCAGEKFITYPNVYYPSDETLNLIDNWHMDGGDAVLDIGTGTGVLAIFAAKQGAKSVLALDHNPNAVRSAKENVERHGLADTVTVKQSDMFDEVEKGKKFDVIVANLPFTDQVATDIVEESTYDESFKNLKKYYSGIKKHLKDGGRAYVTRGNFGGLEQIFEFAEECDFVIRKIGERKSPPGDPRIDYAFELTKRKPA